MGAQWVRPSSQDHSEDQVCACVHVHVCLCVQVCAHVSVTTCRWACMWVYTHGHQRMFRFHQGRPGIKSETRAFKGWEGTWGLSTHFQGCHPRPFSVALPPAPLRVSALRPRLPTSVLDLGHIRSWCGWSEVLHSGQTETPKVRAFFQNQMEPWLERQHSVTLSRSGHFRWGHSALSRSHVCHQGYLGSL